MIPRLLSLPRWAYIAAGFVALTIAAALWLHFHDRGVVKDYEDGVQADIATQSAQASAAATDAINDTRTEVEKSNADARKAADLSDDTLGAGIGSLRADQLSRRAAARRADDVRR